MGAVLYSTPGVRAGAMWGIWREARGNVGLAEVLLRGECRLERESVLLDEVGLVKLYHGC
jgi:hypothetical protein